MKASDESVKAVWMTTEEPIQVALEYASALRVYVRPAAFPDAVGFYEKLQAQGIPGDIREIAGVTGIIGHGDFTTQQLIEIAETVKRGG